MDKQVLIKKMPEELYKNVILDKIKKNKNIDEIIIEILKKHYGEK